MQSVANQFLTYPEAASRESMNDVSERLSIDSMLIKNAPNNFNLLRLAAALLVLFSHAYPVTGRLRAEPLVSLSGDNFSFGSLGVGIFFIISGFLISKSFADRISNTQFAVNRALRIYPGLIAVVIILAFILGPLLTTTPLQSYFLDASTWSYLQNASGLTIQYFLPGVFETNPFPTTVNGSLWTIPVELFMYLSTLLGGVLASSLSKAALPFKLPNGRSIVFFIAVALVVCDFHVATHDALSNIQVLWLPSFSTLIPCAAYYVAGATAYLFREKIFLDRRLAAVSLLVFLGSFQTPEARELSYASVTYLVLYFAFYRAHALGAFHKLTGKNDLSYGIYLWGCPVQQTLEHLFLRQVGAGRLFFMSLPVTLFCAFVSWNAVEKPFLKLKRHRTKVSPKNYPPSKLVSLDISD